MSTQNINKNLPGYPSYPAKDDIFNHDKEEPNINPADLAQKKVPNGSPDTRNEKDFDKAMSDNDLELPGAELDEQQENIGSEDEENHFYSLGGDEHNDLDEN